MTEEKFRQLLSEHDWSYYMSDSYEVWRTGLIQAQKINAILNQRPEFFKIYNNVKKEMFQCK